MSIVFETYLAISDVDRGALDALAARHDLRCVLDLPLTDGACQTVWENDDLRFVASSRPSVGRTAFMLPFDAVELIEDVDETFGLATTEQAIAAANATDDELAAIRAIFALDAIVGVTDGFPGARTDIAALVDDAMIAFLTDERELVRWAAASRLAYSLGEPVELALAEAADRFPDLGEYYERVAASRAAAADGVLFDHPTDSWWELFNRARAGAEAGQWTRVALAMDQVLETSPDHVEALYFRALAHEGVGEYALALALLAACEEAARFREEDWTEEIAELHPLATQRVIGKLSEGAEVDPTTFLPRLHVFRDRYHRGCEAAAARALLPFAGEIAPLLAYLAGSYDGDTALLERAVAASPDSPEFLRALGAALLEGADPQRGEELLRSAIEMTGGDGAETVALTAYLGDDIPTRGDALSLLCRTVYQRQDWHEAGALADEWVKVDPRNAMAWQIRPNARTFALEHELAAELYEEAIETLEGWLGADGDSVYFGDDPLPAMHFNHACVLSKLGRRDEAIAALRRAVRSDAKWADAALEDDYFGSLMQDEEFVAICALRPDALVAPEELDPEFIEGLVQRARGLSHGGNVDGALEAAERAAELAEILGHVNLLIDALNIQSWTMAIYDDPGWALEIAERAVSLAEDSAVDDERRAETLHYHGVVLQAAQQYDRANAAYEGALELRRAVFGDAHPYLAKSFGDMARLANTVGDTERGLALLREGAAVLAGYLAIADSADEALADALVDRAILLSNVAHIAWQSEQDSDAISALVEAADAFEALYAEDYTADQTLRSTIDLASEVIRVAEDREHRAAADAVAARLEDLLLDPDPEIRAEQRFWNGLRDFCQQMLRAGVTDDVIAETLTKAMRGDALPRELLAAVPALGGLANSLAQRVDKIPTLVVLAPLALDTAAYDGDVVGALDELEGICIASILEARQ